MDDARPVERLSLNEVLGRGLATYRERFAMLVGLCALTYLPLALISLAVNIEALPLATGVVDGKVVVASQEVLDRVRLVTGVTALAVLVGASVSIASLHHALTDGTGRGGVLASAACALRRAPAIVGLQIAAAVLALGIPFLAGLLGGRLAGPGGSGSIAMPVLVALAVWVFAVALIGTIALAVLMHEGVGPVAALGRSARLVAGRPTVAGLALLTGVVIGLVFALVRSAVTAILLPVVDTPSGVVTVHTLATIVPSILLTPLVAAMVTVAYGDLRARVDGPPPRAGVAPTSSAPPHDLRGPSMAGEDPLAAPPASAIPGPRWAEPLDPF